MGEPSTTPDHLIPRRRRSSRIRYGLEQLDKDPVAAVHSLESPAAASMDAHLVNSKVCRRRLIGGSEERNMVRHNRLGDALLASSSRVEKGMQEELEPEPLQREGPQPPQEDLLQGSAPEAPALEEETSRNSNQEQALPPPAPAQVKKPKRKKIRAKVVRDDPPKPRKKKASQPKQESKGNKGSSQERKRKRDDKGKGKGKEVLASDGEKEFVPKRKRTGDADELTCSTRRRRSPRFKHESSDSSLPITVEALERALARLTLEDCLDLVPKSTAIVRSELKGKALKKYRAKTVLDPETLRVWKMLVRHEPEDEETSMRWESERRRMTRLVKHFINVMHIVQGNRRFSRWKGSVVDSCVGVFLTQNTSDILSSNCFINLGARFPAVNSNMLEMPAEPLKLEQAGTVDEAPKSKEYQVQEVDEASKSAEYQVQEVVETALYQVEEVEDSFDDIASMEKSSGVRRVLFTETGDVKAGDDSNTRSTEIHDSTGAKVNDTGKGKTTKGKKGSTAAEGAVKLSSMTGEERARFEARQGSKKSSYDWEMIRNKVENATTLSSGSERTEENADSIDWEAVLAADVMDVAKIIKGRGMSNMLAGRIQAFLRRIKEVHKTIDLEWLRRTDPKMAKEFLLTVHGLGLKSVECVRLLTLEQPAFPVDVNVGRICVRLGWVPIENLPDGIEFHNLDLYPIQDTVQKYLWPRLCKLDQETLYELHYQLITCGKVFCTKTKPNCEACPLRRGCYYYHSKHGQKLAIDTEPTIDDLPKEWRRSLKDAEEVKTNPVIEEPPDEKELGEQKEAELPDIEDCCKPSMPHIDLTQQAESSRDIVILPHSAQFPTLVFQSQYRTVHMAYVLKDDHPIVQRLFCQREARDSGYYLLVIYHETCDNYFVDGTILIPCRTALRGSFPLNGTYFQVNEAFAHYQTSVQPLRVSRDLLWNLNRCFVYFGNSVSSIFRETSTTTHEIQNVFWNGYMCIRAFNTTTRESVPLSKRLHKGKQ